MNGYNLSAVSLTSQEHRHFLTGFENPIGTVIIRQGENGDLLIMQQDFDNNIGDTILIPNKELKNLAVWILRGIE